LVDIDTVATNIYYWLLSHALLILDALFVSLFIDLSCISLPESGSIPSARRFVVHFIGHSTKHSLLSSAFDELTTQTSFDEGETLGIESFAECHTLDEMRHSAKCCEQSYTRQKVFGKEAVADIQFTLDLFHRTRTSILHGRQIASLHMVAGLN
jgi:hypothetical protein